ncbi:MAG: alpha/beta hydrolase [Dehalococcoidia bacterium]|jgi:pimeloyl-ACP methyl ester carboxylesterase|nr:alpha/beta hydrolase [Dehalococcoidia bacterium]
MPILKFNSLDISYQVSGSGPLLILHHGFGSWGGDWSRGGWIEPLERCATVLTFDAVGHGRSTRSHDTADHEIERRAAVVIALADEFGSEKFGFIGFSLGGRVGFELAASHPERLSVLAIGGMHLPPPSAESERIERRIRVLRSGRAKSVESPDGDRPGNDPLALAASQEALLRWQGATGRLDSHNAPTLLFCGEKDSHFANAKETAASMNFAFVALPGTDHIDTFFSPGFAVNSVAEFVRNHLE